MPRLLGRWLAVVACITGLVGAQGAAAQPLAVPSAEPPFPNLPQGFALKLPPNCKQVSQLAGNGTPQPINDFPTPGSVVTSTSVVTQSLPYIYTIIVETFITHTYSGDLDISLISPAGTKVTLSHRNSGGNDNVYSGTVWSDFAVTPATDAAYQNNVAQPNLVPEEAMGAFQGESGTGTWSLVVSDLASDDTGTLQGWLMAVISLNEPPVTTTTHYSQTNGTVITDTSPPFKGRYF